MVNRAPRAAARVAMKAINLRIAEELGVREQQVAAAISFFDGGATVPFVARYHFVARISSWAKSALRIDIYLRRTYSGRPSFSIRLSDATAMATSVVCRPSVRERSASPITRL